MTEEPEQFTAWIRLQASDRSQLDRLERILRGAIAVVQVSQDYPKEGGEGIWRSLVVRVSK